MSKEEVLKQTSGGKDFFDMVMGQAVKARKKYKCPFYDDTKPAVYFYEKDGQWLYYDFGDDAYKGDVFAFAAEHYGIGLSQLDKIIERMATDLHLNSVGVSVVPSNGTGTNGTGTVTVTPAPAKTITLTPNKDYKVSTDPDRFKMWYQYADKEPMDNTLARYHVRALEWFKSKSGKILHKKRHPIYATPFGKALKIYNPGDPDRKHEWIGDTPEGKPKIYGIDQLPEHCETILIVEGPKDMLVASAHGYNAIAIDNAQTKIPADLIEKLKQRSDEIILCLDNDSAGLKGMKDQSAQHQLPYMVWPKAFDIGKEEYTDWGKDISDFFWQSNRFTRRKFTRHLDKLLEKEQKREAAPIEEVQVEEFEEIYPCGIKDDKPRKPVSGYKLKLSDKEDRDAASIAIKIGDVTYTLLRVGEYGCICGLPGHGKTAIIEEFIASHVADQHGLTCTDLDEIKCYSFGKTCAIIDTERGRNDTRISLSNICSMLNLDKDKNPLEEDDEIKGLDFYVLAEIGDWKTLIKYLADIMTPDRSLVIIDGILDLVPSMNSEEATKEVIHWIRARAERYGITVLMTQHPNKNTDVMAGHLGSNIYRWGRLVLLMKPCEADRNTKELTATFSMGKMSHSSMYEFPGLYRIWSKEKNRHVPCKEPVKVNFNKEALTEIFTKAQISTDGKILSSEVKEQYEEITNCKPNTSRNHCQEAVKVGFLNSEGKGVATKYWLNEDDKD